MRPALLAAGLLAAAASTAAAIASQRQVPAESPPKGIVLDKLAWPEAEAALGPDAVVVIPVGAASKEHGPHLALRNDLTMAEYLTKRVVESSAVVAAPPLTYHFYPAFVEYPGSTTLTADTARSLTIEVVRSLARSGPRRFYALNTGISTSRPLEAAARVLAAEGILLGYTDLARRLEPAAARIRKQEGGTHADEIETSMMLHIDPSAVDMSRAVRDYVPDPGGPPRFTRQRGGGGIYSPSGIWGDPTLATREKGQILVEALVKGILDDIEQVRRASLPASTAAAPAAAGPNRPGRSPAGTPRPSGCSAGDERAVRQLGDAFAFHWSNADALRIGGLWTEGGDIVHPDGTIERTREVIITNRFELFRRPEYRGSKHPLRLTMIRCVDADVAVADGRWELRSAADTAGNKLPPFEGQVTLVAKRSGGGWLIDAYRYTVKTSATPPTLLKRPGWPGMP